MPDSPDNSVGSPDLKSLTGRNWISLRKFGELIGKSYPTVLKMATHEPVKVKAIKIGGQYRIYEEEVRRFLTEGNAKPED